MRSAEYGNWVQRLCQL